MNYLWLNGLARKSTMLVLLPINTMKRSVSGSASSSQEAAEILAMLAGLSQTQ
jgi:hypothetical protein